MSEYKLEDAKAYEKHYNDDSFWKKIKGFAKKVGCEGIRAALLLYYALENPELPIKTKAIIYAALGYFISPIDIIPDITPIVGFSDDIGILAAALGAVAMYINADVKAKAATKLTAWFGEGECA